MPAKLLEGKSVALKIKENIKLEIELLKSKYGAGPKLVSVYVGENPVSEIYIKSQEKTAKGLGITYELKKIDAGITREIS